MNRQVGLFGGSFNPIHNGHLHLAKSVRKALALDEVLLMPAGEAPHKSTAAYAPARHRLEMCRIAAKKFSWMRVSDYEISKNGKSYTVETLRALRETAPGTDWGPRKKRGMSAVISMVFGASSKPTICMLYAALTFSRPSNPAAAGLKWDCRAQELVNAASN